MHAKVETRVIEEFQQKYFGAFPVLGSYERDRSLDNWHNSVRHQLEQFGFIQTPHFNRRRYFFGRPDDDRTLREAIAYAPQSMTADEIDTGLIRLWEWGKVQPLIQVHDSILFQFPAEAEDEIVPAAMELLKVIIPLKRGREFFVPCEAKVGFNWADQSDKNPLGLIKYKPGVDDRKRPAYYTGSKVRSFRDMLDA